jgi:hypothetical protein
VGGLGLASLFSIMIGVAKFNRFGHGAADKQAQPLELVGYARRRDRGA